MFCVVLCSLVPLRRCRAAPVSECSVTARPTRVGHPQRSQRAGHGRGAGSGGGAVTAPPWWGVACPLSSALCRPSFGPCASVGGHPDVGLATSGRQMARSPSPPHRPHLSSTTPRRRRLRRAPAAAMQAAGGEPPRGEPDGLSARQGNGLRVGCRAGRGGPTAPPPPVSPPAPPTSHSITRLAARRRRRQPLPAAGHRGTTPPAVRAPHR